MALIQITKTRDGTFKPSVDALFDSCYQKMTIDEDCLDAIRTIDHGEKASLPDVPPRYYETPFGSARYDELSSGVKCILLIMHQIKHPELNWTINFDSAGPNAKEYAVRYLLKQSTKVIPFKLYCRADNMFDGLENKKCFISEEHPEPTTLSDIITEEIEYKEEE